MTDSDPIPLSPGPRDTVAQLKADIDSGRTGDKVAAGDPGLSPLGTDDEAAGRPPSAARIHAARLQELSIGAAAQTKPQRERAWFIPTLLATLMLIVVVVAFVGLRHALIR